MPSNCRLEFYSAQGAAFLIQYRSFLNSDPPRLVDIWNSQEPLRGVVHSITPALLEEFVFAKPYFDRRGLIVAEEARRPVGFVHGGFGPTADFSAISKEVGVVCRVAVVPHPQRGAIADELLSRCEQYLVREGAHVLQGGAALPLNPFYLGLYGGSGLPGVLATDQFFTQLLGRCGYCEVDRYGIFQLETAEFRPVVDRRQMLLRRSFHVDASYDTVPTSWWWASSNCPLEYVRFRIVPRSDHRLSCGQVDAWLMEPFCHSWGRYAVGLVELRIDEGQRRQGLATYLVGEAVRQLRSQGAAVVEMHANKRNEAALGLMHKTGFREIEEGVVFRKALG